MISLFLHSIAAQVRSLVASGKALHVSEKTADELELVAGLFKEPVRYQLPSPSAGDGSAVLDVYLEASVTPADIAWAWLKLSRMDITKRLGEPLQVQELRFYENAKRAAECAELATIGRMVIIGTVVEQKWQGVMLADPHAYWLVQQGTREGARAAWMHIANQLKPEHYLIADDRRGGKTGMRQDMATTITEIGNRYRRELEAM